MRNAKNTIVSALLAIACVGALLAIPVTAHAQLNTPVHYNNGNAADKCIGLSNDWAGDWVCNGHDVNVGLDQWWTPVLDTGRVYAKDVTLNVNVNGTIVSYTEQNVAFFPLENENSRCLSVDSGYTNQGARLRGWSCTYSADQFWAEVNLPFMPSGYFYLLNGKSGLVAGVYGGSTSNGASVVQWAPFAHSDQYWKHS